MTTVILVPRKADGGRRDAIWAWVRGWISDHHDYRIVEHHLDGPWNPSRARNAAANAGGDWDVAVFWDADTIAHPAKVEEAIRLTVETGKLVNAADSHMYLDKPSSDRIMAWEPWFPRPAHVDTDHVYARPSGGILAITRTLWNATGGYLEAHEGWGEEDLTFLALCNIFGPGNTWTPDSMSVHLWHPPADRSNQAKNRDLYRKVFRYQRTLDAEGARRFLTTLGHFKEPH